MFVIYIPSCIHAEPNKATILNVLVYLYFIFR